MRVYSYGLFSATEHGTFSCRSRGTWRYPHQLAENKALIGESGDNIAGVPGIGRKKAVRLLNEYGTLTAMLDAIPRLRNADLETVKQHRALALRALSLVTLRLDVPIGALCTSACVYRRGENA